ncbi:YdiK family protein [Heyndrickxia ginsengihumi]|uniref:YdiK family protein n=1 Tax=Heyndrickxia ginsengihumi TaxID=363870 RepID=A0A6M0PA97_9BACI|nr:YdiK family protein [Heyndrickxia ginsengihumi]NEY21702.1 YdiK family protein [Heyndrickxia ginsengihumi]
MRPLLSGLINFVLGVLFTYFAFQQVQENGWGFFSYLLLIIATLDIGSGLRLIFLHFKIKNSQKK